MKIKLLLFSAIILLSSTRGISQEGIDDSYKSYLHDGKAGTNGNVIKFNISGLASGDVGLHYERKITRALSIEVGGLIMPYNALRGDLWDSYLSGLKVTKGLYGFSIQPRFYLFRGGLNNGPYIGLMYKRRYYDFTVGDVNTAGAFYSGQIPVSQFTYSAGIQLLRAKRLLWDLSVGGSKFWFKKTDEPIFNYFKETDHTTSSANINICVKLGILF